MFYVVGIRHIHNCKDSHPERLTDLTKYENGLNSKNINFPVKVRDINQFEKQNPRLPEINVFSINEQNKIYLLRLNEKDCQNTIDLFLYEEDGKEVYQYDYVQSLRSFYEKQLPPKSEFYSKLSDEDISDEDYQHARNVWKTIKCKTIKDYHYLYLQSVKIFDPHLVEIHVKKTQVYFNKPIYVLQAILDLPQKLVYSIFITITLKSNMEVMLSCYLLSPNDDKRIICQDKIHTQALRFIQLNEIK